MPATATGALPRKQDRSRSSLKVEGGLDQVVRMQRLVPQELLQGRVGMVELAALDGIPKDHAELAALDRDARLELFTLVFVRAGRNIIDLLPTQPAQYLGDLP